MKHKLIRNFSRCSAQRFLTCSFLGSMVAIQVSAADNKSLGGHVPAVVSRLRLQPVGRPSADTQLRLAIGLPLHNKDTILRLLDELYDPQSVNYHKFLTLEQFTQKFGPTEQEYQSVIEFAQKSGLQMGDRYANRVVLDVSGKVADIEQAFHVTLRTYQHPTEARQFFAPEVEPSVDSALPILNVSGLENYSLAHPNLYLEPAPGKGGGGPSSGSGPGGTYLGTDFRNAYAPGVALDGTGQIVGLFEEDGYYATDIINYENLAGLPHVTLQNVVLDGLSGGPSGNTNAVAEVSLDIEMAIAMAPGLSKVVVFEGNNWDDILNSMVSHTGIKQFSCSWGFSGSEDGTMQNDFLEMALQGQSFFLASGDGDAFTGDLMGPDDERNITTVGGTALTMNGSGVSYASETVWNWGYRPPPAAPWWYGGGGYWGSGGGISTRTSIPGWQQGISMAANGGSTTWRNIPDVALTATGIHVIYFNGLGGSFGGTSCAAPLWAGFTALVNQQAASQGQPSVGFLNPALYKIGKGSAYTSCFNDTTTGNNTSSGSPSQFYAVTGFDLCTGWGTPNGMNLINALVPYSGAVWVDFTYTGSTQDGSFEFPFKTLAQGVTAVSANGHIWIKKAGTSAQTMTITKAMGIRVYNGAATIGR